MIATAHNTVLTTIDSTAHAEVNAIRVGCKHTGKWLSGRGIVATTCEPCPMCMSALHWARVDTVYFGATVQDAADVGFNELYIDAQKILSMGGSKVKLIGDVLADECRQLFHRELRKTTERPKTYLAALISAASNSAVTFVLIPPRGVNAATIFIRRG